MAVTRRGALKGAAAGAAMGAAMAVASTVGTAPAMAQGKGRTFVLIHGAWHGGWCWRYVADVLAAKGHRVYAPSLTGLADRSHLLSASINLDTHIADIVNLFRWEDLSNVVLVAHSYGGWPVSGALEKIGAQVASVVFVDAFLPETGQTVADLGSAQFREQIKQAIARGDAGRPVPKAEAFGILDPKNREWVQSRMTPQPTGLAMQPITLAGARDRVAKKTYIRAPGYAQPNFDAYYARAKADPSWRTYSFPSSESGHDVMVDAPARLAAILEEVA